MSLKPKDGGPAFPRNAKAPNGMGGGYDPGSSGMSLRDYFAAAALSNPQIYGPSTDAELIDLFGKHRNAIRREEIVAARAYVLADALIAARGGQTQ